MGTTTPKKTTTTATTTKAAATTEDTTVKAPTEQQATDSTVENTETTGTSTEKPAEKPAPVDPTANLTAIGKLVHAKYGDNALPTIEKLTALTDVFSNTDFNTARCTNVQKEASFDALLNIYNEVLNSPLENIGPAMDYVVQYYSENRMGAFRPVRTMMLPITTRNITQQTARFVSDMNQLVSALSRTNNANGLRKIIRLDGLLSSLRSDRQRQALSHYISTIDL